MRGSSFSVFIPWLVAVLTVVSPVFAWGPHDDITRAALDALPGRGQWESRLGKGNFNRLANHAWMPDEKGAVHGDFFVDDYLLMPTLPSPISHMYPALLEGVEAHARRALQALRTETPTEAVRQIGPLLHYIQDAGAPPHARSVTGRAHGPMETWLEKGAIRLSGYTAKSLGEDPESAVAGIRERVQALADFSSAIGTRILPLVREALEEADAGREETAGRIRRRIEPLVLEAACESARVSADVLHTLFSLGLQEADRGAGIEGVVAFPAAAGLHGDERKGARLMLLDAGDDEPGASDLYRLATSYSTFSRADGHYRFQNLPPGRYRLAAYRVGARFRITDSFELKTDEFKTKDFRLSPTVPEGNLVLNPDFSVACLEADTPDYWSARRTAEGVSYLSHDIRLQKEHRGLWRFGGVFQDAGGEMRVHLRRGFWDREARTHRLPVLAGMAGEDVLSIDPEWGYVRMEIKTGAPVVPGVDRVWFAPASPSVDARTGMDVTAEPRNVGPQ